MSAILATSGAIRSLVDGTLRLTVDIEPKDAQAAFALFGRPGSAVALARITDEAAVAHDRQRQAEPDRSTVDRKPLSLASKVALTCGEHSFHHFLEWKRTAWWKSARDVVQVLKGLDATTEDIAATTVRDLCGVSSRSLIKVGTGAAQSWATLEADYHHWQRETAA